MRKLVLIIVGIFLISFASATITVYKPNDPVTNVDATIISGSLEPDTYLIRVVVLGNESPSWAYRTQLRSPPSNMVNITLDSTGGIRLNWMNSTDGRATANFIFIKKGTGNWLMFTQMGNGGVIGETYDLTTWTTYSYQMDIWHNDSNSPDPNVPFGLNQWNGTGMVKITGNAGTLYFSNIVTAIKDAYGGTLPDTAFYDGFYGFAGFWSIDSYYATSGSLSLSYWDLWLMSLSNNDVFQMIAVGTLYQQTSISFPMQAGAATYIYWGNANLQGITIDAGFYGMDANYWGNTQMEGTSSTFIQNSRVHLVFPKIRSATGFQNTHLFVSNALVYHCGNEADPILDIQLITGSLRYTLSSCGSNNLTYRGLYSSKTSGVDLDIRRNRAYATYPSEVQVIDSNFETEGNLPSVYFYIQGYTFRPVFVGNSINIKVVDENGNPVENANVTMNNENKIKFSVLTSFDGNITEQIVYHHEINRSVYSSGYADTIINRNPYNITITKNDYADYSVLNFNLSDKLDWTIVLSPPSEVAPLNTTHFQIGSSLKLYYSQ